LQIGLAAALVIQFSPLAIDYQAVLAGIAFASVLVWLVAVVALARRRANDTPPATA
jgi:hypothetical protein